MKNVMRVLSLIALTGTALAAASNASFAARRPHAIRQKPVAHAPVTMKHKRGPKKVSINLERGKGHKGKLGKKTIPNEPVVTQS